MATRQLRRELAVLLALKVVALAVLFQLFFAPARRQTADASATARALLSSDRSVSGERAGP